MDPKFELSKYSKRHHYIPIFYLLGFINQKENIHVYDKKTGNFLAESNPDSKFFIKNLYNYVKDSKIQFTLEESYYTPEDTRTAPLFRKIINEEELTNVEKFAFLHSLLKFYWRLPSTDNELKKLISKERLINRYFGIYDKEGKRNFKDEDVSEIKDKILSDEQNLKIFKPVMSNSNAAHEEIDKLYDKWNAISVTKDSNFNLITGDNPFLINNPDKKFNNVFDELIFPIGNKKLLILSNKAPKFWDSILCTNINLSIYHNCERFVCSHDKSYLEFLIQAYEKYKSLFNINELIKETFNLMYKQSEFASYEEYLIFYNEGKQKYFNSITFKQK